MAAERIKAAITETLAGERPVKAILDPYNPKGSTAFINFTTSKETRWQTDPRRCHSRWQTLRSKLRKHTRRFGPWLQCSTSPAFNEFIRLRWADPNFMCGFVYNVFVWPIRARCDYSMQRVASPSPSQSIFAGDVDPESPGVHQSGQQIKGNSSKAAWYLAGHLPDASMSSEKNSP